MPEITFHALRHTHASQLIASGVDIVTISKRLGHAKPSVTLAIYAHMFHTDDRKAAAAINAAFRASDWVAIGWQSPLLFSPRSAAKSLKYKVGEVAEWLKAAVC